MACESAGSVLLVGVVPVTRFSAAKPAHIQACEHEATTGGAAGGGSGAVVLDDEDRKIIDSGDRNNRERAQAEMSADLRYASI